MYNQLILKSNSIHITLILLSRKIAFFADWGSIATISCRDPTKGFPFSNVMSFSDGISPATSTGIPYMYFTDMEMSVHDLKCKNQMTLSMTLAQGDYCSRQNLGTQSISREKFVKFDFT